MQAMDIAPQGGFPEELVQRMQFLHVLAPQAFEQECYFKTQVHRFWSVAEGMSCVSSFSTVSAT
jgi:hypothetical protein